jgi:hypothetical protein
LSCGTKKRTVLRQAQHGRFREGLDFGANLGLDIAREAEPRLMLDWLGANTMKTLVGSCLMSLALCVGIPAFAQELPRNPLSLYSNYRAAMLSAGWKPIPQQGVTGRDGKPMYVYAEVVCGNRLCSADWSARDGRKVSIALWRNTAGKLVVAPQIEFS